MTSLAVSIEFLSHTIEEYDFSSRPLIVGISGPQGSGKSYLTDKLAEELRQKYPGKKVISFSMDDLYLTHKEQSQLNERAITEYDNNLLLQGRGLPGTHDIDLGLDILNNLIALSKQDSKITEVRIPSYDKAAFNGEGDRDEAKWKTVNYKVDIVLFEGWFNGFVPLDNDQLRVKYLTSDPSSILQRSKLPDLELVNEFLHNYTKIWDLFDRFIFLRTSSIDNVYKWRIEQEHNLIKAMGTGMSDQQVVNFVNRYMPLYHLYYENMCDNGVLRARDGNLRISIDEKRVIVETSIF
ncbi:P-loop containing nucleoside triphosphate hydrolase protein [Scheffersomyces xylosifermentans]|uniref:P-loop containing nucleoside triphosphate hydrolase protein n=1 Tax=Scheffersomyces xylosifermentans TaxID=1304137 RepID=UPI00315CEC01